MIVKIFKYETYKELEEAMNKHLRTLDIVTDIKYEIAYNHRKEVMEYTAVIVTDKRAMGGAVNGPINNAGMIPGLPGNAIPLSGEELVKAINETNAKGAGKMVGGING